MKSCEGVYSFTEQGAISQKLNDIALSGPQVHVYVKNCQSGVSFVALGCLDGQVLVPKFTKFDQ